MSSCLSGWLQERKGTWDPTPPLKSNWKNDRKERLTRFNIAKVHGYLTEHTQPPTNPSTQLLHPHPPLEPEIHAPTTAQTALPPTPRGQDAKPQEDLTTRDQDAQQDQNDDDPGQAIHLVIGDVLGENLGEVEEDAAALVEDLDAGFDLEVFAHGAVEGVEGGFGIPD